MAAWLLVEAPAAAQVDLARAATANGSMMQLIEAVRKGETTGDYPRLSDPDAARLFARAFDDAIVGPAGLDVETLTLISRLQQHSVDLARAYILAGTGLQGLENLDAYGDMERVAANFVEYLPEIAVAYDFSLMTGARIADLAVEIASDAKRNGIDGEVTRSVEAIADEQIRVVRIMLGCSSDANIVANWRRERLVVLNRTAPRFAALFGQKKAQGIADRALAAAIVERDREVADQLKQFALALLR